MKILIKYPYDDWWKSVRQEYLKQYGECILIFKEIDLEKCNFELMKIFNLDEYEKSAIFARKNGFIHQICRSNIATYTIFFDGLILLE